MELAAGANAMAGLPRKAQVFAVCWMRSGAKWAANCWRMTKMASMKSRFCWGFRIQALSIGPFGHGRVSHRPNGGGDNRQGGITAQGALWHRPKPACFCAACGFVRPIRATTLEGGELTFCPIFRCRIDPQYAAPLLPRGQSVTAGMAPRIAGQDRFVVNRRIARRCRCDGGNCLAKSVGWPLWRPNGQAPKRGGQSPQGQGL